VGGLGRALLLVLTLSPLLATGEPRSAFEGPGLEFGLLLGWQSFQQQGYFELTTFPGAMGGIEIRYRFANGFGLGVTVTANAHTCYDDVYDVSPCLSQVPVVLELSYSHSIRGVFRPWVGVGAGVGLIQWGNLAIDQEAEGYQGSGVDVEYFRLRAGFDVTFETGRAVGVAVGPFLSASFGTGPLPGKDNVNVGYASHQTYAVGLRLMVVVGL
jgi:hypothetical protein